MVRNLIVKWPDGVRERFGDLQADRIVVLHRGSGQRLGTRD